MGDKASFRYAGTGLFGFPHNETQNGYQKTLIEGGTEGNDKDDATSKLQLLWEPTEKISLLFAGGETSKEGESSKGTIKEDKENVPDSSNGENSIIYCDNATY